MFQFIDKFTEVVDRYNINLYPIYSSKFFVKNNQTRFFSINGSVESDSLNGKGMLAGVMSQEFNIVGQGIVIEMPGINFPDSLLVNFKSGIPGSLSYIDGCSNSCIVPPPRNGEPCLNYLYFPPNINQTEHVHPSIRIGIIVSGKGYADVGGQSFSLEVGKIFVLDRFTSHRFRTENESMSLIAFHPDSDDGPTDEFNPMKTRTYIPR